MNELHKLIDLAKESFYLDNQREECKGHLHIEYFIKELMKDEEFHQCIDYIFSNKTYISPISNTRTDAILDIVAINEDVCNTIKEDLKNIEDREKLKEELENFSFIFNEILLTIVLQSKLIIKEDLKIAILISLLDYYKLSSIGTIFELNKITRDDIFYAMNFGKETSLLLNSQNEKTNLPAVIEPKNDINKALGLLCDNINIFVGNTDINDSIGNENILQEIEESLTKRNKSGVVIVGKSGIGKDQTCLGFVKNINKTKTLKNHIVWRLNVSSLQEGNVLRGQLESKINLLVTALDKDRSNILYIEDLQELFSSRPDTDISGILLPQLIKKKIKTIATIQNAKWNNCIDESPQLTKYFHKIDLKEPSIEETIKILEKNLHKYEKFYNISMDKICIGLCVDLTNKNIFNKCFPEKAFDVLDNVFSKAKHLNKKKIDEKTFIECFSIIMNLPIEKLENNDLVNIKQVTDNLKKNVIDQDEAIDKIVNHIAIGKAGLREDNKTICNIFLKAQSGVGKTMLAQRLSEELNIKLVRFDMSEYSEQHSVAKLLGTPPGYVGFSNNNHGSLLLSAIEQNPRCVLLLDEIEKAHSVIHNVLLQAMDNGVITGSTGKEISLKNVILIMTSNVGANAHNSIGFDDNIDTTMEHMDSIFKPEFKTRLDAIISMNPVSRINVKRVIELEINKLNVMLEKYKKKIVFDGKSIEEIEKQVKKNNLGLRIVRHIFDTEIKSQIVYLLSKKGNLKVIMDKDNFKVKLV